MTIRLLVYIVYGDSMLAFMEMVPSDAEVVADYRFAIAATAYGPSGFEAISTPSGEVMAEGNVEPGESEFHYFASGVALVPILPDGQQPSD